MPGPSDDQVFKDAIRRGWLEPADRPALLALREAYPGQPLAELLVEAGRLTREQAAELDQATLREERSISGQVTALPGRTIRPGELDRLSSAPLAGRYEFGEALGAGGMGEVLGATDPALGRRVAYKRMHAGPAADPRALARFLREARITAQLAHPLVRQDWPTCRPSRPKAR